MEKIDIVLFEENEFIGKKITGILRRQKLVGMVAHVIQVEKLASCIDRFRPDFVMMDISSAARRDALRLLPQSFTKERILFYSDAVGEPYSKFTREYGSGFCIKKEYMELGLSDFLKNVVMSNL